MGREWSAKAAKQRHGDLPHTARKELVHAISRLPELRPNSAIADQRPPVGTGQVWTGCSVAASCR